ncbi:hypothetical protein MXAN_6346 [Myxococcus xanthus DK 1622]|uniref:Lipoprotein n=1 Tax=Myxococcus xanthus (strain DK1622) TaxID=246197 RepID=Q1CYQ3_MYXXD|nr:MULTISPECIES: hypothetical protein [Myxococcus]ABF92209.1 hypothetical protein MXAN_6346 [Myxococcus xanthus DK 1622]NOJ52438.1 hypothetical protein [Myxococcus xanthus]QPM78695.1 hypothetical protein I5Q59_31295 [Myxococcus xanthus]QVW67765.1 hypothetical protein JTM82_36645 [Myxococcus xanthus DZ2]QZZ53970.1 hypothetical protein MyxoNM_32580 [Myxococcus xanthus]
MKVILMNLAATAALATTAVLLVADSGEKGCHQPAQSVTFDVGHNTCGAPGILRVSTPQDTCRLDVEAEERTGLPMTGDVYDGSVDLRQGDNWYLADMNVAIIVDADGGTLPGDAGTGTTVEVNRACEVLREGEVLRLKCTARRADLANEPVSACEAVLTPR